MLKEDRRTFIIDTKRSPATCFPEGLDTSKLLNVTPTGRYWGRYRDEFEIIYDCELYFEVARTQSALLFETAVENYETDSYIEEIRKRTGRDVVMMCVPDPNSAPLPSEIDCRYCKFPVRLNNFYENLHQQCIVPYTRYLEANQKEV